MSITIIDKTKPQAPILVHKEKPTFKSDLEKQRYWAKRKHEDLEGIGDIPGTLVHKTQEQWIKDRDHGNIFRPICRDVDLLVHQQIAECRKKGEALVVIKGRGVGLSTEFGCLGNYFMKMYPGTTSFLTSQEKAKIAALFSEKIALTYDRYDDDIKPAQINRNETLTNCYLKIELEYLDEFKKRQINTSQVICRETSDSPASASAFSGQGAIFGGYDELFLHKRRDALIRSSTSCFMNARTRTTTGFLMAGGTCEDTLTNEQISDLQLMIDDIRKTGMLQTMKARLLFIPSWMGTFMTNGWSDEKKGIEWWEQSVDTLDKMEDKSALRAFKMNNPLKIEDIFDMSSGGAFEEDVSDMIKAQLKQVRDNPVPVWKGKFISLGNSVSAEPATTPNIFKLEEPKQGVEYFQLIDGVGTGKKTGNDEGSEVASIIVKGFDPLGGSYSPVNIYLERPNTVEQSYRNIVNQFRYYNVHEGMKWINAEGNMGNSDHFSTYLDKEGLWKYIFMRKDLSGKGHSRKDKPFQYVNNDVQEYQYRWMNIFLRKYIHNIKSEMLLLDLLKPKTENADLRSAFLMLGVCLPKDFDQPIVKKIFIPPPRPIRKMVNGRLVWTVEQPNIIR